MGRVNRFWRYHLGGLWARIANLHRVRQRLSDEAVSHFAPRFPHLDSLDLRRLSIKDHANLPPSALSLRDEVALRYGYRLYYRYTFNETDPHSIKMLLAVLPPLHER